MAFNTSYTFTAVDKFTSVADKIEKSLGKINIKLNKMQQLTQNVNRTGVAGLRAYDREIQKLSQHITQLQSKASKGIKIPSIGGGDGGFSGGGTGGGVGMAAGLSAAARRFAVGYAAYKGTSEMVQAATAFETATAQFSAQTAIYGERTKQFEVASKQMGYDFKMSPSLIMDGFKTAASELPALMAAGQEKNLMEFTATATKLANAAQMSPEETARAIALMLNAQGKDATYAGKFAEMITASMQLGTAPISSILEGQQNLGAVAANAGISPQNELALLQVLNKTNLPAVSGTGLRRIIENFGQQGISFAGRDPFEVFKRVSDIVESETDLKKKKAMQEALYGEFGRMNLALIQDIKGGQQLAKGIAQSQGTLEKANAVVLDTTSKNWDQLKSSLSELSIVIFSKFAPSVNEALKSISSGAHNLAQDIQSGNGANIAGDVLFPTGKALMGSNPILGSILSLTGLGAMKYGAEKQNTDQTVNVMLKLDDPMGLLQVQGVTTTGASVGINNAPTNYVMKR